jgi:hypothetical protein
MNEPDPRPFAERLLALEPVTPELRRRYEAALEALLERRLSRPERWLGWLGVAMNLTLVGLTARGLLAGGPRYDGWGPLLVVSVLALLGLSGWMAFALVRGSVHRLRHEPYQDAVGAVGVVAFGAAVFWLAGQSPDPGLRLELTALALLFFGAAGGCAVWRSAQRRHLETKLKLLELELHLAELAQKLDRVLNR